MSIVANARDRGKQQRILSSRKTSVNYFATVICNIFLDNKYTRLTLEPETPDVR